MELRLKRNSDIIEGRARAYELIEQNITSYGGDGEPLLVRYRDQSGKIRTIIVMIGPDGNYSTFEDNAGGTAVTSVDGSVRVSATTEGYDLSVLSPEIIEYLNGLTEYKYSFSVSTPNINLDLATNSSCRLSATISSSKSRDMDGSQTAVAVTGSESSSSGWSKTTESRWDAEHIVEDRTANGATYPFSATVTNADGKTGTVSGTARITYLKPWYLIEHGEDTPTAEEIDSYMDGTNEPSAKGSGYKDGSMKKTEWSQRTENYYWIVCPKGLKVSAVQMAMEVINEGVEVPGTTYGDYMAYRSISRQAAGSEPVVDITITKA